MTTTRMKQVGMLGLLALALAGSGVVQYRRIREQRRRAPRGGPRLAGVRIGLPVRSSDAIILGRVAAVWRGIDPLEEHLPVDEAICSRLEVQGPAGVLYVPYNALGGVEGGAVILSVRAADVRSRTWRYRPDWLPPRGRAEAVPSWAT